MSEFSVVAIDGPAGAGKSTIAKSVANCLGYQYLDTGAMYRSLTLKALRVGTDMESEDALEALAKDTMIDLKGNPIDGLKVFLDDEDVSDAIRTLEVTNHTFYIARTPKVRAVMVKIQQKMGAHNNIVMEGRDIGTVVFPDARYKFYLDATVEERASRRYKEFIEKGKDITLEQVIEDVKTRDHSDFTREVGPLKKADDAVVVDSTKMTIEEVVDCIIGYVKR